ncbi:hypothetical protein [Propionibacterium acidifaciens]|uniref:hypothetical protein n=1 Tax=Propionibacterium acidifaciens TaxID=556499 RepID=UPI00360EBA65
MSTRYRLDDHWHTAASLAALLEEDPTRTREVARALRTPRTIEPACAIDALEDVIDRIAGEDTTDITRRDALAAACRDAADAIADHKQTSHHLNACLWGLRDAFKACKETRS